MKNIFSNLNNIIIYGSIISGIGSAFYIYGVFDNRLSNAENKDYETVSLEPINEKISNLEVNILDRLSDQDKEINERIESIENEWADRDNNSTDELLNDIAGINLDIKNLGVKLNKQIDEIDNKINEEIKELQSNTFKEFGKTRDLIAELNKEIEILKKEIELIKILFEELETKNSNPLGQEVLKMNTINPSGIYQLLSIDVSFYNFILLVVLLVFIWNKKCNKCGCK